MIPNKLIMNKKNNFLLLVGIVLSLSFYACNNNTDSITTITGKIKFDNGTGYVLLFPRVNGEAPDTLFLKDDDTFEKIVTVNKCEKRYFSCAKGKGVSLFLKPGRKISLNCDKSFKPEVTGSPETIYHLSGPKKNRRFNRFSLSPDEYIKYVEKEYSGKMSRLDSVASLYPDFDKGYQKELEIEAFYSMINSYVIFRGYKERIEKRLLSDSEFTSYSKKMNDLGKRIDFNNPDLMNYYMYKRVLFTYFREKADQILQANSNSENFSMINVRFDKIQEEKIANQQVREFAFYAAIKDEVGKENIIHLDGLLKRFTTEVKNQEYVNEIIKKIDLAKKLGKGAPAPGFSFEDIDGRKVTLEDLRGQYVYIDVWATTCGPCLKQMPFLKEIKKEFKGENISFICISVDKQKDKEKWKKMVAKKAVGGIQLLAGDQGGQFKTDYLIKGIPHFILLDKDGKIIKNNCSRPSEPETRKTLWELIEKG